MNVGSVEVSRQEESSAEGLRMKAEVQRCKEQESLDLAGAGGDAALFDAPW
jgi:hypothetical protein